MAEQLGAHLVRKGLITQAQLDEVLKSQLIYGGSLGTNLVELGLIDLDTLGGVLSEVHRYPLATAAELEAVTDETLALLKPELAREHLAFPLALEGRRLKVAMANPFDPKHVDALGFATGLRIVPSIVPDLLLAEFHEKRYGLTRMPRPVRPPLARAAPPPPAPPAGQPPGMKPSAVAGGPVVPGAPVGKPPVGAMPPKPAMGPGAPAGKPVGAMPPKPAMGPGAPTGAMPPKPAVGPGAPVGKPPVGAMPPKPAMGPGSLPPKPAMGPGAPGSAPTGAMPPKPAVGPGAPAGKPPVGAMPPKPAVGPTGAMPPKPAVGPGAPGGAPTGAMPPKPAVGPGAPMGMPVGAMPPKPAVGKPPVGAMPPKPAVGPGAPGGAPTPVAKPSAPAAPAPGGPAAQPGQNLPPGMMPKPAPATPPPGTPGGPGQQPPQASAMPRPPAPAAQPGVAPARPPSAQVPPGAAQPPGMSPRPVTASGPAGTPPAVGPQAAKPSAAPPPPATSVAPAASPQPAAKPAGPSPVAAPVKAQDSAPAASSVKDGPPVAPVETVASAPAPLPPVQEAKVEQALAAPVVVPTPRAEKVPLELPSMSTEEMEVASNLDLMGWKQNGQVDTETGHQSKSSWADRAIELDGSGSPGEVPLASAFDFIPSWQPSSEPEQGPTDLTAAPETPTEASTPAAPELPAETLAGPERVRFEEAVEALHRATTQGALGKALLSWCQGRFSRAFLLGETFGVARVGRAYGVGSDTPEVSSLRVDLDAPSLLAQAAMGGQPVVSSLPEGPEDKALFEALGASFSHLLAAPIRSRQRTLGFVVIDGGASPFAAEELEELRKLLTAAAETCERL